MESLMEFLREHTTVFAAGATLACVAVGTALFRMLWGRKHTRVCGVDYPKDTVILHLFAREKGIPTLGHFCVKLETYLRVNKIPYEPNFEVQGSPKGKTPWIEYNGTTMGDSQLILEFLEKEFKVDLNAHLNPDEKALAWAIQKWLEEWTYWLNVHIRWLIHADAMFERTTSIPKIFKLFLKGHLTKLTSIQGVGRHTVQEVEDMLMKDLKMFSQILGKKPYIMGGKLSDVDCSAFGILSQLRWATPEDCHATKMLISGELPNVNDYLNRIKNQCYPDWDTLTNPKK